MEESKNPKYNEEEMKVIYKNHMNERKEELVNAIKKGKAEVNELENKIRKAKEEIEKLQRFIARDEYAYNFDKRIVEKLEAELKDLDEEINKIGE